MKCRKYDILTNLKELNNPLLTRQRAMHMNSLFPFNQSKNWIACSRALFLISFSAQRIAMLRSRNKWNAECPRVTRPPFIVPILIHFSTFGDTKFRAFPTTNQISYESKQSKLWIRILSEDYNSKCEILISRCTYYYENFSKMRVFHKHSFARFSIIVLLRTRLLTTS